MKKPKVRKPRWPDWKNIRPLPDWADDWKAGKWAACKCGGYFYACKLFPEGDHGIMASTGYAGEIKRYRSVGRAHMAACLENTNDYLDDALRKLKDSE